MTGRTVSTKDLNKIVYNYILQSIDGSGYDVELKDDKSKLEFLFKTFVSEYSWSINRYGVSGSFREWIPGLPSCFNIDFENYKILELAYAWGSLSREAKEWEKDRIISGWFNFITVKTFQLFKKNGILK